MSDLVLRFFLGGLIVSVFAVVGDLFKPKSFAGIFGAAPAVALATLGITFVTKGSSSVALSSQAMIAGSVALFFYSLLVAWLLIRHRAIAWRAAGISWLAWLAIAFALWGIWHIGYWLGVS